MKRIHFAAIFAAIAVTTPIAQAKPPEGSNGTYADFYQSLKQPGTDMSCCQMSDCRATSFRPSGDGRWQFFISRENFRNNYAPDNWVTADKKNEVLQLSHPMPYHDKAVACYVEGKVACYVLPNRTVSETFRKHYSMSLSGRICLKK